MMSTSLPRRIPTPRVQVQRKLVVDAMSEHLDPRIAVLLLENAIDEARLDSVPGWSGLRRFARGALQAQLSAALGDELAAAVLQRIEAVIDCVQVEDGPRT